MPHQCAKPGHQDAKKWYTSTSSHFISFAFFIPALEEEGTPTPLGLYYLAPMESPPLEQLTANV